MKLIMRSIFLPYLNTEKEFINFFGFEEVMFLSICLFLEHFELTISQ